MNTTTTQRETFIACAQPEPIQISPSTRWAPVQQGSVEGERERDDRGSHEPPAALLKGELILGMLPMAWLGRVLTQWQPQAQLRHFSARLHGRTRPADQVACTGAVTEVFSVGGENRVTVRLSAVDQDGATKVIGEAVVALP